MLWLEKFQMDELIRMETETWIIIALSARLDDYANSL